MTEKSSLPPAPLARENSSAGDAPKLPPVGSVEAMYLAGALCSDYNVAMPPKVADALRDLGWVLARVARSARAPVVFCVLDYCAIQDTWPGMANRNANAPTGDPALNAFVSAVHRGLALQ